MAHRRSAVEKGIEGAMPCTKSSDITQFSIRGTEIIRFYVESINYNGARSAEAKHMAADSTSIGGCPA